MEKKGGFLREVFVIFGNWIIEIDQTLLGGENLVSGIIEGSVLSFLNLLQNL